MKISQIDYEAALVRHKYSTPVDPTALCEEIGVQYAESSDMHQNIVGQVERLNKTQFKISIRSDLNETSKRFACAHELAHVYLHQHLIKDGVDDSRAYLSTSDGQFQKNPNITASHEREANAWAVELLLPEKRIRAYCAMNNCDRSAIPEIAKLFKVNTAFMTFRFNELGLAQEIDDDA